ncbi:Pet127-domain-containing protein, partial [Atractiella rhizophila]
MFVSSTSQVGGPLEQIFISLSRAGPNYSMLKHASFRESKTPFGSGALKPAAVELVWIKSGGEGEDGGGGRYAVDAAKWDTERDADAMPGVHWFNMLSKFGTLGEALLTSEGDKFEDYLLTRPKESQPEKLEHVYHYSRVGRLIVRSQLDSWNPNLPKPAFDVKTRPVMPLRIDPMNYQTGMYYRLTTREGELESFEREYFDLIRNAFLKYSFQARLGNMDGIFCAHHNGKQWFGFQYIPLEDMDAATCGSVQQAEQAFGLCTALLERVLVEATAMFPRENVRLVFDGTGNRLAVFVNPTSDPDKRVCMRIKTESYLNGRHVGRDVSFTNFADGGSLDGIEWTVKMSIEVESEVKTVKRRHDLMLDKVARSHFLPPNLLDEEVEMALEGVEEQVWIGTREKRNRIMLLPGHSYTNDPPRMVHEIRQLSLKAYNQATGKKNEIVDPDMERELPPHLAYKAASRSSDSPPPVSTSSQNEKVPSLSTDNAASNIGSSSAHRDASTGSFESSVATEDISSSSSHNENVTDSDQVTPLS